MQRLGMTGRDDPSNGYDAIADTYIKVRSQSGRAVIADWATSLPIDASVLDLGTGYGEPYMPVLLDAGLTVSAIDAAPSMVAAFQKRFPAVEIACEPVEESRFFGRSFDAVLAIGLIFLLPETAQQKLISKISNAVNPKGKFLFSAPIEIGTWDDVLTHRSSISLGQEAYCTLLGAAGFDLVESLYDDGGSHYYSAVKR